MQGPGAYLLHSHAKEGDVPGTVNLKAADGDDTAYGQALYPWSNARKTFILVVCSLYSFLGNSALLGPYANLAFGFGSLLLMPLYYKIGRRPYCAATSYASLMAARVIHSFGSGVCEALPVQLVNDIFFLHERGKRLGYYTVCLCFGSTGPLYAVRLCRCAPLFAFFVVEETAYRRTPPADISSGSDHNPEEEGEMKPTESVIERAVPSADVPLRKTFIQTLKFWGVWEKDSGIYIGLGALTFNFIFPIKITHPPYNWSETNSGLIAVTSFLGYLLAIPFTLTSDRLAAHLTRKNNGIREAEMRLGAMLPVLLLPTVGLIVFSVAAEKNLPWIAYFAGVTINQFASYFYFTFTLAYAIDSYHSNISEMLIAMNLGKQAISFGMGLDLLNWIMERGYAAMITGIFSTIVLVNNLCLIIFMIWGKKIRKFMATTWLARMHGKTIKEIATH
ncbi:major facilitator superfamily domain-containing protein [Diplogelasinospora grovesii]|uniref:Major facilitator superfamily domain-containing protein n=1 Tax=Diplogelasinospora grovesii TaxID=303347 RepID=A0AAN6MXJ2_9PEZI|nr:major facilitator superfamily domain-containing protein [Diplogelasinospora grovesii]